MRAFPVYCMNPTDGTIVRVGSIMEMRKSRRSMNRLSLAKLAKRLFARDPGDIIYIGPRSAIENIEVLSMTAQAESAG